MLGRPRPARDEARRQLHLLELRPAPQPQRPSTASIATISPAGPLVTGSNTPSPDVELLLLHREVEAVDERASRPAPARIRPARGTPIDSESSTSSSGVISQRAKNHHHTGRASRRWYSSRSPMSASDSSPVSRPASREALRAPRPGSPPPPSAPVARAAGAPRDLDPVLPLRLLPPLDAASRAGAGSRGSPPRCSARSARGSPGRARQIHCS